MRVSRRNIAELDILYKNISKNNSARKNISIKIYSN